MKIYLKLFVLGLLAVSLVGCNESSKKDARREKLAAHSNYNAKVELEKANQQIEELDGEIESLKSQLEMSKNRELDCMTDKGTEFMDMITPIMEEMTALKQKNLELKAKLNVPLVDPSVMQEDILEIQSPNEPNTP